ncbi:MAG: hypothetical protein JSV80_11740, partial [Acidobacteriota bacterium]
MIDRWRRATAWLLMLGGLCAGPSASAKEVSPPSHPADPPLPAQPVPSAEQTSVEAAQQADPPLESQADEAPEDSEPSGPSEPQRREQLEQAAQQIQSLLDGDLLADISLPALFAVDLLDEQPVRVRARELGGQLARADVSDAVGEDELTALERRVAEARLAFLSLEPKERRRVVEAERSRRELARERQAAESAAIQAADEKREAEQRHREAIAQARQQTGPLLEELSRELARAEAFRADLAQQRASLADTRASAVTQASAQLEVALELESKLQQLPVGNEAVDALLGLILEHSDEAARKLEAALADWEAPSRLDAFQTSVEINRVEDPAASDAHTRLRRTMAEIAATVGLLRQQERDARWAELTRQARSAERFASLRENGLSRSSRSTRSRLLGLTREGVALLQREARELLLNAKMYLLTRWRVLRQLPEQARDFFSLGSATLLLLKAVFVLGLAVALARRRSSIVGATRQWLAARVQSVVAMRRVRTLTAILDAALPWLVYLVALWLLWRVADPIHAWPESRLIVRVLAWYGSYRLVLGLALAIARALSRRYRLAQRAHRQPELTRTMRLLARTALTIGIVLVLTGALVGRGHIYHAIGRLLWLVAIIVALVLLRRWREPITETYFKLYPAGFLRATLERSRGRSVHTLVAAAALIRLASHALLVVTKDFALRFDQARTLFAVVSRRRIERRSEREDKAPVDIEQLPEDLRRALSASAELTSDIKIDHFPGVDQLREVVEDWRAGRGTGDFLLIGERGIGKSTWLRSVRADGLEVSHIPLTRRPRNAEGLISMLAPELLPADAGEVGLRDIRRYLAEQSEPRMIVLDDCHHLVLATVGGYEIIEAVAELIEATNERVFWLCSF